MTQSGRGHALSDLPTQQGPAQATGDTQDNNILRSNDSAP